VKFLTSEVARGPSVTVARPCRNLTGFLLMP
jgi:hypothetical protein